MITIEKLFTASTIASALVVIAAVLLLIYISIEHGKKSHRKGR